MWPLPAAAATRVDASSTSAASELRLCIAAQRNRSTRGSQEVSFLATPSMHARLMRPICKVDDAMQVQIDVAASCGPWYTRRCV
jgi:hypothetical protein